MKVQKSARDAERSDRSLLANSTRRNVQNIVRDLREFLIADSRRDNSASRSQQAYFPGLLHGVRPCVAVGVAAPPNFDGVPAHVKVTPDNLSDPR